MHTLQRAATALISVVFWPITVLRRGALQNLTTLEIFLGGFGLVVALLAAALLSPALGALPGGAGDFAPIGMAVLLAPVGVAVALGRRADVERMLRSVRERTDSVTSVMSAPAIAPGVAPGVRPVIRPQVIVDTSAIIDGRLADVVESGFLLGDLVIPRFVLDELRRVADSSDSLKRQRGRRGLELLARIQASAQVRTEIDDQDFPDAPDVDAKVLALARARNAAVLTADFNLGRVAGVEALRVLNINGLAQAMRTVALPGERLSLQIHQEGRERNQGVGFLADGTMVVVEEARQLQGREINVEVTRIIQTSAGRMLFGQIAVETLKAAAGTPAP